MSAETARTGGIICGGLLVILALILSGSEDPSPSQHPILFTLFAISFILIIVFAFHYTCPSCRRPLNGFGNYCSRCGTDIRKP